MSDGVLKKIRENESKQVMTIADLRFFEKIFQNFSKCRAGEKIKKSSKYDFFVITLRLDHFGTFSKNFPNTNFFGSSTKF